MAISAGKFLGRSHANCTSLFPSLPLHYTHPPNAIPAHVRIPLSYSEHGKGGEEKRRDGVGAAPLGAGGCSM